MSSTILMAIVLVVMWLVVLVPMFVRRHDDRAENRSMDRFATAMRVLSRRPPPHVGPAPRGHVVSAERSAAEAARQARARMLARRRRTVGVLGALAVGLLPGALALTSWLWLPQAAASALLVGVVGWLRSEVRRQQRRRHQVPAAARDAGVAAPAAPAAPAPTAAPAAPAAPAPTAAPTAWSAGRMSRTVRRTFGAGGWRSPAAGPDAGSGAEPVGRADGWQPVPVPPPLYVNAAVARHAPDSVVELDDDDPSFLDLDQGPRTAPAAADLDAPPAKIPAPPRAVNE